MTWLNFGRIRSPVLNMEGPGMGMAYKPLSGDVATVWR